MLLRRNLKPDIQLFAQLADDIQTHTGALTMAPPCGSGKSPLRNAAQFMRRNAGTVIFKDKAILTQGNIHLTSPAVFGTVDEQLLKYEYQQFETSIREQAVKGVLISWTQLST